MGKEPQQYENLPKQLVKAIASVAATLAVEAYQEEINKRAEEFNDKRFRNTKLLIKKYGSLRDYCENAIYSTAQICAERNDDIYELLGIRLGESHKVGSIRNNVIKTDIIMEHINAMLECYKAKCERSSKPEIKRRWRVLQRMYLDRETMLAQDVADLEHISVSMVYQDIDSACEDLTPLFFGLDWTSFWM